MFRKILIANRGEIACRIIATARRMGIATVAVHSDADAAAPHVAMADEAVRIGPAAPAESYLRGDRIVAAARQTGAEAVHPGYGFLSENADFAEAVAAAGLTFVGPPAAAIAAMGLKDAAKSLMEKAGVPVVPGYHGARQEPEFLAERAAEIGYPVLIKARAGGGGKGMRLVAAPRDFPEALAAARREAQTGFGDPAVLVERFVAAPRHVEVQILADGQGHILHLFERDCSLQRRHQKVIEEAPAPGMDPDTRAAIGRAAVEAARAVGYVGAGTVEFIADGSRGLRADAMWFMEMNTRLQVEHPVTEAVTGLDLVEWQLRVAAGQALPFAQDDLSMTGHAVEARIYAEDPARDFLPATGRLTHLRLPPAARFVPGDLRLDAGVAEGDEVTPHYDPMIGKLIAHAPDRTQALARLRAALAQIRIAGCTTNVGFLHALAGHPDVLGGRLDTGLIDRGQDALRPPAASPGILAVAAVAGLGLPMPGGTADWATAGGPPWQALTGWRAWGPAEHLLEVDGVDGKRRLRVGIRGPGRYRVADAAPDGAARADAVDPGAGGDDEAGIYELAAGPDGAVSVRHRGRLQVVHIARDGRQLVVFRDGAAYRFALPDIEAAPDGAAAGDVVVAPMPGLVKLVRVAPGADVGKGQPLIVLEAMKMEHGLSAPRDGQVAELLVAEGDQVSEGAVLLRLAPEDGEEGGTA